jgi:ABC-2 type transport system permease protein
MSKVGLIIKREYLSRVRKKTFILTTILTPLLFIGMIAAVVAITVNNVTKEKVAVVDKQGVLKSNLKNSEAVTYDFRNDIDTSNFKSKGFNVLLLAPHSGINQTDNFQLISQKSLNRMTNERINKDISRALESNMISQELKIDPFLIDSIRGRANKIKIDAVKKDELGKLTSSNFDIASSAGYASGFLIYITLFIYGVMVMRGVMEEKTNRIAEVIISSVKPFQLMMGKIIGIGAVGLTQFLIWIILITTLGSLLGQFLTPEVVQQVQDAQQPNGTAVQGNVGGIPGAIKSITSAVNWPLVIGCFLFYFFGGYLFYASLFAAVGSAVNEDSQDAQSLSFPITLPIILAIIIMINAINDPGSSLATWASIIPFFSPIVMMARIPFGVPDTVPYWQLGLSMVSLIAGFLFTTWLGAKIYRTGILLYGKKPTWKEMIKWIMR